MLSASAKNSFRKVASVKANSPFVGYARFRLAEILEKEQHFEPMRLPEQQLKRALIYRIAPDAIVRLDGRLGRRRTGPQHDVRQAAWFTIGPACVPVALR